MSDERTPRSEIVEIGEQFLHMVDGRSFAVAMTAFEYAVGRLLAFYSDGDEKRLVRGLVKHAKCVERMARFEQQADAGGLN